MFYGNTSWQSVVFLEQKRPMRKTRPTLRSTAGHGRAGRRRVGEQQQMRLRQLAPVRNERVPQPPTLQLLKDTAHIQFLQLRAFLLVVLLQQIHNAGLPALFRWDVKDAFHVLRLQGNAAAAE